jgi:hypothetical protein
MKLTPGEMLSLRQMAEKDPAKAGPGWRALSEAQTALAAKRTGGKPYTVMTAPGASPGAPGVCAPGAARILLEGELLPESPENLQPEESEDHFRALATLHGVFVHECGHARHTPESRPQLEGINDQVLQSVILLEEIRMEARVVEDNPDDAKWLRASAKNIILENSELPDAGSALASTVLVEGRVFAGSLEQEDVREIAKLSEELLEKDTKKEALRIARETTSLRDDDVQGLLRLAEDLAKLFPKDASSDSLKDAIESALGEAAEMAEGEGMEEMAELLRSAEARAEIRKALAASEENTVGAATGSEPGEGEREATTKERLARNRLAEKLKRVRWRERIKTKRSSLLPPGRLRTREALRRSAEADAGKLASAKPWKRTVRKTVPYPKLTMGILLDTSGSMSYSADEISGSLWAIANATADNGGMVAASLFGNTTKTIVSAGNPPRHVKQFQPHGGTDHVRGGIELLSDELVWEREEGPRILTIISDGYWMHERDAIRAIEEIRDRGILVIHIGVGSAPPDRGADETLAIRSVADLPEVLGERAAREMRLW